MSKLSFNFSRNIDAHKEHPRISTREIRDNFSEAIQFVSSERDPLVLTKHGEDRVAIIPLETLWAFEELVDDRLMNLVKMGASGEVLRGELLKRLLDADEAQRETRNEIEDFVHPEGPS